MMTDGFCFLDFPGLSSALAAATSPRWPERGSGCSAAAAARVVPVSLVSCHITSLQNWFLLSAFHPEYQTRCPPPPLLPENLVRLTGGERLLSIARLALVKLPPAWDESSGSVWLDRGDRRRRPEAASVGVGGEGGGVWWRKREFFGDTRSSDSGYGRAGRTRPSLSRNRSGLVGGIRSGRASGATEPSKDD